MPSFDSTPDRSGNASSLSHLMTAAQSHLREGEYPSVLDVTARILQIDPDCIEAYQLRTLIHRLAHDWEQLVSDCTELIRLQPELASSYRDRAQALIEFGQPERAIVDCNRAIELAPYSSQAYFTRGHAFAKLQRVQESQADLRRSFLLTAAPESIAAIDRRELVATLLSRASKLIDSGEYGQAVEACSAILCDEPEHIEARQQRGIAYQRLGRFEESSLDLAEAWRLKEEHERVGRSYVVTLEGDGGEKIYGAFPETPQGRMEAESAAEGLVADQTTHEALSHLIGEVGVINIYHIEGTDVEKIDWIWITREDGPSPIVDIDLTAESPE